MRILKGLALLGLPLALFGVPSGAHEVNLSLNDSAVRATYATVFDNGLRLDGGWLGDSDEGDVVHVSALVVGNMAKATTGRATPSASADSLAGRFPATTASLSPASTTGRRRS
jgi:hypothetical protein